MTHTTVVRIFLLCSHDGCHYYLLERIFKTIKITYCDVIRLICHNTTKEFRKSMLKKGNSYWLWIGRWYHKAWYHLTLRTSLLAPLDQRFIMTSESKGMAEEKWLVSPGFEHGIVARKSSLAPRPLLTMLNVLTKSIIIYVYLNNLECVPYYCIVFFNDTYYANRDFLSASCCSL